MSIILTIRTVTKINKTLFIRIIGIIVIVKTVIFRNSENYKWILLQIILFFISNNYI